MTPQRRNLLLAAALLLLSAIAYWPGLSGGFLFDDYPNIIHQPAVQATSLDAESLARAANAFGGPVGRPLAMVSLAIDHAFWGMNPWGYKATNLAIHLVNALLVFVLVRRLLESAGAARTSTPYAAFAVSLAWAAHPLQVSTVLYVVQRMETMSFLFVFLALLAYLQGRRRQIEGGTGWPWLVASGLGMVVGITAKESAILLPVFTLALELTLLRFSAASPRTSRLLKGAYGVATLVAVIAFVAIVLPRYTSDEAYAIRDFTLAERLLTQLRALPTYIGWILLPRPGSYLFYYDNYPVSTGLLEPATTLAGAALLLALLAAAVAARRKAPLVSLGILWFFGAHLLTSNVVPLELVFEHRNYFAALGVMVALAGIAIAIPAGEIPRIRTATVGILLAGLFLLTLLRSASWGDPLHLALELAQRNPGSARASADLGEQYMLRANRDANSPFYAMAANEFERGAALPDASTLPEQALILLATTSGQPVKAEWWDRIIRKMQNRAIGPQEITVMTGFLKMRDQGMPLDDLRFAEAYVIMVNRMNMPPSQYYAFGLHAMRHLGNDDLAQQLFEKAVDKGKANPGFVAAITEALYSMGEERHARELADYAMETARIRVTLPEAATQPESP